MASGPRGEIPSEHGALCSGEKNDRAAAGEKSGADGEKLVGEVPRAREAEKTGVCLEHEAPRKKTVGKKIGREAPKKKGCAAAEGRIWA